MSKIDQYKKTSKDFYGKDTKYFGQWETDKVIEGYFRDQTLGQCIEVGASDGVKGSNSLYFEMLGWQCICVEPNPKLFKKLIKNRNCKSFNVACGTGSISNKDLEVFVIGEDKIESSLTSLKFDKRLLKTHGHLIKKRYKIKVQLVSLSEVVWEGLPIIDPEIEKPVDIDFISIDTEGTELDVLKSLDFEKIHTRLLVVENNFNDEDIEEYLKEKGYIKDQHYKVNDFYIRRDEWQPTVE